MGLISGMMMGVVVGVALMAGWSRVMRHRSRKRVAKVWFQDYYITTVGFGCWEQPTPLPMVVLFGF
jgi:Uri superfamily endonuclease